MEKYDFDDYQGKRKNQVESSEDFSFWAILVFLFVLVAYGLYVVTHQ